MFEFSNISIKRNAYTNIFGQMDEIFHSHTCWAQRQLSSSWTWISIGNVTNNWDQNVLFSLGTLFVSKSRKRLKIYYYSTLKNNDALDNETIGCHVAFNSNVPTCIQCSYSAAVNSVGPYVIFHQNVSPYTEPINVNMHLSLYPLSLSIITNIIMSSNCDNK